MAKVDDIVLDIVKRCGHFGVSVLLPSKDIFMHEGMEVAGLFDDTVPSLSCAVGGDPSNWLGILLHEYCHVTQWVEQCDVWREYDKEPWGIDDWLEGKRVPNLARLVDVTQRMEADCERRTVRLIKELDAPVNLGDYCQQANAYLHFYNVVKTERKWYAKGKGPYRSKEVWPLFNKTIDTTFKTTAAQRKALLTCV